MKINQDTIELMPNYKNEMYAQTLDQFNFNKK